MSDLSQELEQFARRLAQDDWPKSNHIKLVRKAAARIDELEATLRHAAEELAFRSDQITDLIGEDEGDTDLPVALYWGFRGLVAGIKTEAELARRALGTEE